MPPYHTIVDDVLTVYLDLTGDPDGTISGNLVDSLLDGLDPEWPAIASANGLSFRVALPRGTRPPLGLIPSGIQLIYAQPPAGVESFTFTIGTGQNAEPWSKPAKTSYVNYQPGNGYLYENWGSSPLMLDDPDNGDDGDGDGDDASNGGDGDNQTRLLPAAAHELGHVLGLTDRYYDAVCWIKNIAIDRTCRQIRRGNYIDNGNDTRNGTRDNPRRTLPNLAYRIPLPMAKVPGDGGYDPLDNLMSNSEPTLSKAQVAIIRSQTQENGLRTVNWIAVLGEWRRYETPPVTREDLDERGALNTNPVYPADSEKRNYINWAYPVWEASPQDGGQGLLFMPQGVSGLPKRYPCISSSSRGRHSDGSVILKERLAKARGKRWWVFFGPRTHKPSLLHSSHHSKMCHSKRLIKELLSS